ncbi:MAG: hypothetical protein C0467_16160 [Planctomycetaceae bacterium]|nr:hypothetical protein [Planctomycetaceae bacterium]
MQTPRSVIESVARDLVVSLSSLPIPPTVRVADVEGRIACLIMVWDASQMMPTMGYERRRRSAGGREGCKTDIVEVVRAAGRALTRKEVLRELRLAGKRHGPGTVAKALAGLTAAGGLVNLKDKKGYRLPAWRRGDTPSLFS